jgi:hypothetical protein
VRCPICNSWLNKTNLVATKTRHARPLVSLPVRGTRDSGEQGLVAGADRPAVHGFRNGVWGLGRWRDLRLRRVLRCGIRRWHRAQPDKAVLAGWILAAIRRCRSTTRRRSGRRRTRICRARMGHAVFDRNVYDRAPWIWFRPRCVVGTVNQQNRHPVRYYCPFEAR